MADNPYEIPHDLRVVLDQNVQQAHAAYEQLSDLVTNTIRAWMTAVPANPMLTGFQDIQNCAMDYAKENAESVFALAGKISSAKVPRRFWHFKPSSLKTLCGFSLTKLGISTR